MDDESRLVECGTHGTVSPAYVCCHLVKGAVHALGFNEPELEPDDPEGQAWCNACEAVLDREGEWNEVSEAFADIKLICEFCFAALRNKHLKSSEAPPN